MTDQNGAGRSTATEELRRMLDERGVKWHDTKIGKGFITVYEHDGITWIATEHSSGRLSGVKGCVKPTQGHYDGMTPKQAIAATLGSSNCTNSERTGTCSITESFRRRIADAERVLPLVGDTPPQVRIRLDFLKEMLDEIDAEHERRMRELRVEVDE